MTEQVNPAAVSEPSARLPSFARRHAVAIAASPVFVVLAIAALRKITEWGEVYLPAARTLIAGGDIYAPGKTFLYPPFPALFAIPFSPLGDIAERLVFFLVNVAAIFVLARSAWRLSGGPPLDGAQPTDRREWVILALGVASVAPYAINTLGHGQTDLVIDALVTGGCYAVARGRGLAGGALIGLGAAFKGPPLLFAAYFLARRRWREAAAVVLVDVGVNLAPDLIHQPPGGGLWIERWLHRYVLTSQGFGQPLGKWGSLLIYNQSLGGTLQRVVNTPPPGFTSATAFAGRLTTPTLKLVAYSFMAAMLAATLWTAWRATKPPKAAPQPNGPERFALECGAVMALMLMMSPMSGLAHFPILALPALCMARLAVRTPSFAARAAIAIAVAAGLAVNKDLVGGAAYDVLLWCGLATLASAALWAGCIVATRAAPET